MSTIYTDRPRGEDKLNPLYYTPYIMVTQFTKDWKFFNSALD